MKEWPSIVVDDMYIGTFVEQPLECFHVTPFFDGYVKQWLAISFEIIYVKFAFAQ